MTRDGHATSEVEAMSVETLNTGIEMELFAAHFTRAGDEPVEQSATECLRAILAICYQVVHVADAPPRERVEIAIASHRTHLPVRLQISEMITLRMLASDALEKLLLTQVWTKLNHDRET